MFRVRRAVRIIIIAGLILATGSSAVRAADPLVLFVLRMLRDQAISAGIQAGVEAAQEKPKPAAPIVIPRGAPQADDPWLRGLIDESFVHLNSQQREELYASLMRMLNDPRNAAMRPAIIAEFTAQAIALRDAHRQLSRLSEADMKTIAAEARREYERLPAEQRQQMLQVLQHGIPGMPRTLNDLMLAEFGAASTAR